MNKRTVLILLNVAVVIAFGCKSLGIGGSGNIVREKREVADFTSIQLATIGKIILTQGEEVSVEVETDDNILPLIETKVDGNTLLIQSLSKEGIQPTNELIYHITMTNLESLNITGAGYILAGDFAVDDLVVSIPGTGRIDFGSVIAQDIEITISNGNFKAESLEAENIKTTITKNGRCDLKSGKVKEQTIFFNGSAVYFGDNLESENTFITIERTGTVRIWATQTLDVKINGAATVFYRGDPVIISEINGAGALRQIE